VQVDDALVNAHLKAIPGLRALTAWCLASSDAKLLGWHAHGAKNLELLLLGALDQVSAHLLQALDIGACQGDADAMNRGWLLDLLAFFHAHFKSRFVL